ncbi:alpha/beta fold hydrolase [Granulosicoccus sp. 3-233]|uniref:alpha/beta fold hydrolase n=1 Tax=Granulosicoccus sp. 3-233 TaxID=3417969 RepID=UPI003D3443CF
MTATTYTHRWNPPDRAAERPFGIYLLHGTGEHLGRYDRLANHLASQGWCVGAHDHFGHGRSAGQRGLVTPDDILSTVAVEQLDAFAQESGSRPVLFGHSLGGVLATQLVIEHEVPVTGLMLSAPAFVPAMRRRDHVKLRLLSLIAPKLCLDLGYDPSRLTNDISEQQTALADELLHGYKSASLVNWLLRTGRRMLDKADQLNVKTLLMIPGADSVADPAETRRFASKVAQEILTVREYDGYFHELLNESPEWRSRVMDDMDQWLERLL